MDLAKNQESYESCNWGSNGIELNSHFSNRKLTIKLLKSDFLVHC
jgi:hypothetical protein